MKFSLAGATAIFAAALLLDRPADLIPPPAAEVISPSPTPEPRSLPTLSVEQADDVPPDAVVSAETWRTEAGPSPNFPREDDEPTKAFPPKREKPVAGSLVATDADGVRLVADLPDAPRNVTVSSTAPGRFRVRFPRGGRERVGYFLFRVENAADRDIEIELAGVPIAKWWSVNPVVCDDADLGDLDNFVSAPPTTDRTTRAANGPPLPDDSGERWKYVADVEADRKKRSLTFRHRFATAAAVVAMRPPYTNALHATYLDSLRNREHVAIHEAGETGEGRPLYVNRGRRRDRRRPPREPGRPDVRPRTRRRARLELGRPGRDRMAAG